MATRTFEINTEPHEAVLGKDIVYFMPEVVGAEFIQAYDGLREVQKKLNAASGGKASSTKHAKDSDVDGDLLGQLYAAMRTFIRKFLANDEERVKFDKLTVPDRVLVQLVEYVAELYGGGSGNPGAAGGTSTD